MNKLLLVCLLLLSASVCAQTAEQNFSLSWSHGMIIFKTGDTLQCKLRFNQTGAQHLLQVNESDEIITVGVRDVKSFSYFDVRKNRDRVFSALQKPNAKDQEYFMERIYAANQLSIINHKTMEVPDDLNFRTFIAKPVKTHKKYLLHETTGEMLPLSRENLLTLLQSRKDQVLSYVKDRGIRFRRIADFIEVIEYHNSL